MSFAWPEMHESAGQKVLSVHEMGDGFLITMRWNWPDAGIHQEIVYFSPLAQAREIAEQILVHIGRINLRHSDIGASQLDHLGPPGTDNPVP